jgi:hypothetical protein
MKALSPPNVIPLVLRLLLLTLLVPLPALAKLPKPPNKPSSDRSHGAVLPLKVAVGVVQKVLVDYQNEKSSLKLKSADFDFKVQTENVESIGISVWLITAGASRTSDHVSDVGFTYSLPSPSPSISPSPSASASPSPIHGPLDSRLTLDTTKVDAFDINTLNAMDFDAFAQMDVNFLANILAKKTITPKVDIKRLYKDLLEAIRGAAQAVKDTPPAIGRTKFDNFAVTIQYQVKYDANASATIPIFAFLSIGPKLDWNQTSAQTVKLVFQHE